MIKLRLYKFLSIFIPYFKNAFENRINEYKKINLFTIKRLFNSAKPYRFIWNINYEDIIFLIEVEYINNQTEFSFSCQLISSTIALFEMSDFVKFIESMPQDDLKRQFEFLRKS